MKRDKHERLMEIAKRRGFIWPSFELYGGVGGFYDFGPLGSVLKEKIIRKWREYYVIREGFYEIDSPSILPEEILKASGHVDHFIDLMAECQKCGTPFRVIDIVKEITGEDIEGMPREEVQKFVDERRVKCPDCGGELGPIFEFNAMFRTTIGPGTKKVSYLRPETAQTIFIDFKRLQRYVRGKIPFGVVQIGRGFRNEISPRQGIIRLREFTMAEAEVFFDPKNPHHPKFSNVASEKIRLWLASDQEKGKMETIEIEAEQAVREGIVCNELMVYYMVLTKRFLVDLGIPSEAIRFRQQTPAQRAHYSSETWDAEVLTERFGWVEVAGLAYRTDYDLRRHSEFSGEDLSVFLPEEKRKVICHVVEPSYGIDRTFYCVLEHSFVQEGNRAYLKLKRELAPIEVGVFPLLNRDGLPEKAMTVLESLRQKGFLAEYDDSGSIGRRYARADEVGTPYCVTIDHQTLEDDTVTVRDRDTTAQVRVGIEELPKALNLLLSGEAVLQDVGVPVRS